MLFFVWKYVPLFLAVAGIFGIVLRIVLLKTVDKKKPLTERRKMWLWFGQALGFWAVIIGGWMIVEGYLQEQAQQEADEEDEAEERAERKQKRKVEADEREADEAEDDKADDDETADDNTDDDDKPAKKNKRKKRKKRKQRGG